MHSEGSLKIAGKAVLLGALLLSMPARGSQPVDVCDPGVVKWGKCTAKINQAQRGEILPVRTEAPTDDSCYYQEGVAKFRCEDGRWVLLKASSRCERSCLCCY